MKLLNNIDLHQVSAGSASISYICAYSLLQYQNSRFTMLEHAYYGNTAEDKQTWFNHDKNMLDLYQGWIKQWCPADVSSEYLAK
jgi:hypothetical protein